MAHKTKKNTSYDPEEELQSSFFYMLNCLLHSRMQTGIESNSRIYDEDVNMYLAHLLNSFIDPNYLVARAKYLCSYDADLFKIASRAPDDRTRYFLYKTNADSLLMALGIFNNAGKPKHSLLAPYRLSRSHYVGKTRAYYELASSYAAQASRKPTAVSETLQKLSDDIESYLKILSYMRGQYLDLIERFSPGELYHLQRSIDAVGHQELIAKKRDEFLETYYQWLRTGLDDLREKVRRQARQLKKLDPSFDFDLPQ